jgi:DNA repair protein RadC
MLLPSALPPTLPIGFDSTGCVGEVAADGQRVRIAALLMVEMSHLDQEFRVINLNTKNNTELIVTLYRGRVNSVFIRVGEVFKEALRLTSAGIIIAHQYPSGVPDPSPEDILVTRQICEAGKLLDV